MADKIPTRMPRWRDTSMLFTISAIAGTMTTASPVSSRLNFLRLNKGSNMEVNRAVVAIVITAIEEFANFTEP